MSLLDFARVRWSATDFSSADEAAYAEGLIVRETRGGLRTMASILSLALAAAVVGGLAGGRGLDIVVPSVAALGLAVHVFFAARALTEVRSLHLLGMTLVVLCGTAFILMAHRAGSLGILLFSGVGLLYMTVPLVPWGLREALTVSGLVYGMITLSSWGMAERFEAVSLWALQAFMLVSGATALASVARGVHVRKADIAARFQLDSARAQMERRSLQDPLTGDWNRRHLENEFPAWAERSAKGEPVHLIVIDVDDFKEINDRHGHAYGDRVLQAVGGVLGEALDGEGLVARIGGDEFVLLACGDAPEDVLSEAATRFRERFHEAEVSISAGARALSLQPESLDAVYRAADAALYEAKRRRGPEAPLALVFADAAEGVDA